MKLICHMIFQDHVIKESWDFFRWDLLIVSHDPAGFGGHGHCCSGDINFLFLKRKISDALASIWHCCLFLKNMGWKHMPYIINSDPGHTCSNQQLDKCLEKILPVHPKALTRRRNRRKKGWQLQSFLR